MTTNLPLRAITAARARALAGRLGERLLLLEATPARERGLTGPAGTALTFNALAKATGEQRYTVAAGAALRRAAGSEDFPPIGLFHGISGLRAVAALLARDEPHLERLVEQCDAHVETELPEPGAALVETFSTFDVIAGWSGARLARCVTGARDSDRIVDLLAWLIGDDERWRCVHATRQHAPPENDLGLAHGIAGVLATLALTLVDPAPRLREPMERCARKLADRAVRVDDLRAWPQFEQAPRDSVTQAAWCYGMPGICGAMYFTARLLFDEALAAYALDTLEEGTALAPHAWGLNDHALCHGTLGNALVYASVGRASGRAALLDYVEPLVAFAVDGIEADGDACLTYDADWQRYDASGELDGAAGIALALLTLAADADSDWLRLHALAPL